MPVLLFNSGGQSSHVFTSCGMQGAMTRGLSAGCWRRNCRRASFCCGVKLSSGSPLSSAPPTRHTATQRLESPTGSCIDGRWRGRPFSTFPSRSITKWYPIWLYPASRSRRSRSRRVKVRRDSVIDACSESTDLIDQILHLLLHVLGGLLVAGLVAFVVALLLPVHVLAGVLAGAEE